MFTFPIQFMPVSKEEEEVARDLRKTMSYISGLPGKTTRGSINNNENRNEKLKIIIIIKNIFIAN